MRKFLLLAILLLAGTFTQAQVVHQYPALDTSNTFTGYDQFSYINDTVVSGMGLYSTPQAAVTAACAKSTTNRVLVPYGTASGVDLTTITGGCTKVYIVDQRSLPITYYQWVNNAYKILPSSGTNGITYAGASYQYTTPQAAAASAIALGNKEVDITPGTYVISSLWTLDSTYAGMKIHCQPGAILKNSVTGSGNVAILVTGNNVDFDCPIDENGHTSSLQVNQNSGFSWHDSFTINSGAAVTNANDVIMYGVTNASIHDMSSINGLNIFNLSSNVVVTNVNSIGQLNITGNNGGGPMSHIKIHNVNVTGNGFLAIGDFSTDGVTSYSRSSNVATIETPGGSGVVAGQLIDIFGMPDLSFNTRKAVVLSTTGNSYPTPNTITYASTGSNVTSNTIASFTATITGCSSTSSVVTVVASNSYVAGSSINISGMTGSCAQFNGFYQTILAATSTTFQVGGNGTAVASSSTSGTAVPQPVIADGPITDVDISNFTGVLTSAGALPWTTPSQDIYGLKADNVDLTVNPGVTMVGDVIEMGADMPQMSNVNITAQDVPDNQSYYGVNQYGCGTWTNLHIKGWGKTGVGFNEYMQTPNGYAQPAANCVKLVNPIIEQTTVGSNSSVMGFVCNYASSWAPTANFLNGVIIDNATLLNDNAGNTATGLLINQIFSSCPLSGFKVINPIFSNLQSGINSSISSYTVDNPTFLSVTTPYSGTLPSPVVEDAGITSNSFTGTPSVTFNNNTINLNPSNTTGGVVNIGNTTYGGGLQFFQPPPYSACAPNMGANYNNLYFTGCGGSFQFDNLVSINSAQMGVRKVTSSADTVSVTSFSVTSNIVTVAATSIFQVGRLVVISGLTVGTYLNGIYFTITSNSGTSLTLTNTTFTHANVATTTDSGTINTTAGNSYKADTTAVALGWPLYNPNNAVASASSITPTGPLFHMTGTASVSTIAATNIFPFYTDGPISIVADGSFTWATGGNLNISTNCTAVVGSTYVWTYDGNLWNLGAGNCSPEQQADVTTYGADPTGSADSTTAIQAAMNAQSTVFFPCGTYKTTQDLYPHNNQRIIGAGRACTTILASWPTPPGGGAQMFYGGYSTSFKDITLTAPSGVSYTTTAIVVTSPTDGSDLNFSLDHVTLKNWTANSVYVVGTSTYPANGVSVTNSVFLNTTNSINLFDVNNFTLTGNYFSGIGNHVNWDMDVIVKNYTITGNTMICAPPTLGTATISNIVGSTNYFTVTTTAANAYAVGTVVAIYGNSVATYNGDWIITAITDSTHFVISATAIGTATGTGGGLMQLLVEEGMSQGPYNPGNYITGLTFAENTCTMGGTGAQCEFALQLNGGTITGNTQTGGPPYGGNYQTGYEVYGGNYTFSNNFVGMGSVVLGGAASDTLNNFTVTNNVVLNGGNGGGTGLNARERYCYYMGGNSYGPSSTNTTNNQTWSNNQCTVTSLGSGVPGGMFSVGYASGSQNNVSVLNNHYIGNAGAFFLASQVAGFTNWKVSQNVASFTASGGIGVFMATTGMFSSLTIDQNDFSSATIPIEDGTTGNTINYGCNFFVYGKPCNYTGSASGSPATNVTTFTVAGSNLSGTISIVTGASFTTGTLGTITWPAVPGGSFSNQTALKCTASQVGGTAFYGISNGTATTTGMVISASATSTSATITINYTCSL